MVNGIDLTISTIQHQESARKMLMQAQNPTISLLHECVVNSIHNTWRVFAKNDLQAGAIVEQCVVRIPDDQYWFLWENGQYVFGSGLSQLYNHGDAPNVEVIRDYVNNKMYFYAICDVEAGQELVHRYPDWARYQEAEISGQVDAQDRPQMPKCSVASTPENLLALHQMVSHKVKVGPSEIDRLGVFACEAINAGDLIEIAIVQSVDAAHWFSWGKGEAVFCSGVAHLFRRGQANTQSVQDHENGLIQIHITQNVAAGDELLIEAA